MTDEFEIRLAGEIGSERRLSEAVETARESIARALTEFERDGRIYSAALDIVGRRSKDQIDLVALAEALLRGLVEASHDPRKPRENLDFLAELRLRWNQERAEHGAWLNLRSVSPSLADPAGILLVEKSSPFFAGDDGARTWVVAVRDSLASNVMARPDAEYALAVALPLTRDDVDRTSGLQNGLALARSIASVLPAEVSGRPNLLELRVRADPVTREEPSARVRVWRLGFMKIPSRTRFA